MRFFLYHQQLKERLKYFGKSRKRLRKKLFLIIIKVDEYNYTRHSTHIEIFIKREWLPVSRYCI